MITKPSGAQGGRVRTVLDRLIGVFYRTWYLGPPTRDITCSAIIRLSLQRQLGLSLRWSYDEGGVVITVVFGPLDLVVDLPPTTRMIGKAQDQHSTLRTWHKWGHGWHLYVDWRHLGASVEWGRIRPGRLLRVKAGPLVAVMEPGVGTRSA